MPYPSLSTWINPSNDKWWAVQIIKLSVILSLSLPFHLVPLMPKCLPQHPILEHPQLMSVPQCERPSLTPTHNRQNYSSVYFDIYIFDITPTQKAVLTYVSVYLCSMCFHWLGKFLAFTPKISHGSLLKILTHLTLLKLRYLIQRFAICMRVDGEWVVTVSLCGPLSCGAVDLRE